MKVGKVFRLNGVSFLGGSRLVLFHREAIATWLMCVWLFQMHLTSSELPNLTESSLLKRSCVYIPCVPLMLGSLSPVYN